MQPYFNVGKTQIAVLVSHGYGAGWSTWGVPELAWDSRVVEWWIDHHDMAYCQKITYTGLFGVEESAEHKEFAAKLKEWGYDEHTYMGGYANIRLEWVDRGRQWRIEEYDGSEYLVFADEQHWISF